MPLINGGPIFPDGQGGSYENTDADDRAALWQSLGGRQGFLSGGEVSVAPGSMALDVAPLRAAVAERDAAGDLLDRGYHAWSDDATTVVFDPPSAQVRNDALVLAVADTSAGAGAFGAGVTEAGPQLLVVPGVSGVSTPRSDADIQPFVGSGGWVRVRDVTVSPGDTEISAAGIANTAAVAGEVYVFAYHNGTARSPGQDAGLAWSVIQEAIGATFSNDDSRITLPAGLYDVTFHVIADGPTSSNWGMNLLRSGAAIARSWANNNGSYDTSCMVTKTVRIADGDYLECFVTLNAAAAGGNLNIIGGPNQTYITIARR